MAHHESSGKGGLLAGVIIGVLWIAMAVATLLSAAEGYRNDRNDWGLGWGLVGILLLGAGVASIVGSWWHHRHVARHRLRDR
ncbi:MAG: hypothetical protein ACRELV_11740 [Longimicrobiales bacterium]